MHRVPTFVPQARVGARCGTCRQAIARQLDTAPLISSYISARNACKPHENRAIIRRPKKTPTARQRLEVMTSNRSSLCQ